MTTDSPSRVQPFSFADSFSPRCGDSALDQAKVPTQVTDTLAPQRFENTPVELDILDDDSDTPIERDGAVTEILNKFTEDENA